MRIYFDMDNVLADFNAMRPNDTDLNHPSEELSVEKCAAKKAFWREIEQQPKFWHDIPVMPNIENLLSVAKTRGELFVLSKTPGAKHFVSGVVYVEYIANEKRKWIANNLSQFFDAKHVIICDGPKGELVHPTKTDILVDDRKENITEWEAHGGRGILFTNVTNVVKSFVLLNMDYNSK